MLLPQSVIPSISGPVHRHEQSRHRLGQRHRRAGHLGAVRFRPAPRQRRRRRGVPRRSPRPRSSGPQYEVAVAAADAFLTLAAAQETVSAAQAGVNRAETCLAHHPRAGQRRAAARRRRLARRSRTRRRAHPVDPGASRPSTSRAPPSRSFTGSEPAADRHLRAVALRNSRRSTMRPPSTPPPTRSPWSRTPPSSRRKRNSTPSSARTFPASICRASAYARGTGAETSGAHSRRRQWPRAQRAELRARASA